MSYEKHFSKAGKRGEQNRTIQFVVIDCVAKKVLFVTDELIIYSTNPRVPFGSRYDLDDLAKFHPFEELPAFTITPLVIQENEHESVNSEVSQKDVHTDIQVTPNQPLQLSAVASSEE